jgi:hypothetical protein
MIDDVMESKPILMVSVTLEKIEVDFRIKLITYRVSDMFNQIEAFIPTRTQ